MLKKPAPNDYKALEAALNTAVQEDVIQAKYLLYSLRYTKEIDETKRLGAIHLCREVAERGYLPAQYDLGLHYLYGDGVTKDISTALQWIQKSAEGGYRAAIRTLIRLYSAGTIIERNLDKAKYWRERKKQVDLSINVINPFSFKSILSDVSKKEELVEKSTPGIEASAPEEKIKSLQTEHTIKVDDNVIRNIDFLVKSHLSSGISLKDLTAEQFNNISDGNGVLFVFSNPAQKAYTSSRLLSLNIPHNVKREADTGTVLCTLKELGEIISVSAAVVSKDLIDLGCNENNFAAWEILSKEDILISLDCSEIDCYSFQMDTTEYWMCGEEQNVTDICITDDDVKLDIGLNDGTYKTTMVWEDRVGYKLLDANNASILGRANVEIVDLLDMLAKNDLIPKIPERIQGTWITVENGVIREIQGIGRLIFEE